MLPILYCQCHTCWCPGDLRSQGISRYGIDQTSQNIPSLSIRRVNGLLIIIKGHPAFKTALRDGPGHFREASLYCNEQDKILPDLSRYCKNFQALFWAKGEFWLDFATTCSRGRYCRLLKWPWPRMTSDTSLGCSVNKTQLGIWTGTHKCLDSVSVNAPWWSSHFREASL